MAKENKVDNCGCENCGCEDCDCGEDCKCRSGEDCGCECCKSKEASSKIKMTLAKWKQIGRICGYDGTRSASVWGKDADRLRKACPYKMWHKIAQSNGWNNRASGQK